MTDPPLHVLLVEDDPGDATLIRELLHEASGGVDVEWVDYLAKGIDRAVSGDLDVVLLDLSLPDSTGLSTVTRMHTAAPGMPIVVCTGVDDEELGRQAVALGAQDYLVKGVSRARGMLRTLRYAVERERLQSTIRSKDEFLAMLSHELRTPLTAMLGWVRMLQSGRLTEDQARQALESIERNTRVQARLISDLLDVSRIVAGKLQLERQWIDLVEVTRAAIESLETEAAARGVRIGFASRAPALVVLGDPVRLQQVVTNLVGNAVKFSVDRGQIHVILDREAHDARIVVADEGQGIVVDELAHVFELFRQADTSSTRRSGGLGVGLAIVRHIVMRHGGTVTAESGGPGRGAVFTVRLPIVNGPQVPLRPSNEGDRARIKAAPVRLEGASVLVVDDHPDSRDFVATVLRQAGASVSAASAVPEAVRLLSSAVVDVLISDVGMPTLDGFDLIQRLRAGHREHAETVPAIALTAYASTEDRRRVLAAGFQYHAAKPIDPVELVALVARAIADRRSRPA